MTEYQLRKFPPGYAATTASLSNEVDLPQATSVEAVATHRSSESSNRSRSIREAEGRISHDSKPRLSKEQQDLLESHFQSVPKPSTKSKQAFADSLGVSIAKINNWFQNRRAKVKQERKKQQTIFASSFGAPSNDYDGHFLRDEQSYVSEDFFNTTRNLSVGDTMHPSILASNGPVPTVPHGVHVFPNATSSAEHPEAFDSFFGLNPALPHQQAMDLNRLTQYGQQFGNQMECYETHYDQHPWPAEPARSTNDNPHIHMHPLSTEDLHNSLPGQQELRNPSSMMHTMGQHLPRTEHHSDGFRSMSLDGAQDVEMGQSSSDSNTLPLDVQPHSAHSLYRGREEDSMHKPEMNGTTDGLRSTQAVQIHPAQLHKSESAPHDSRRSFQYFGVHNDPVPHSRIHAKPLHTSADMHGPAETDSSEAVIRESQKRHPLIARAPSDTSVSLAQRRQRKPAALGIASPRSASYNNVGSPRSPSGSGTVNANDAQLRRMKSMNGVMSGRVQKNFASPQRSPLNPQFNESDVATRGAKQVHNLMAPAPRDSSSLPVNTRTTTPLTSVIMNQGYNGDHNNTSLNSVDTTFSERPWSYIPSTDASTTGDSVWSLMPNTSETAPSYASPPHTPMDYAPMAALRLQHHDNLAHAVVPQSAPAFQQSFQFQPHNWQEQMMPRAAMSQQSHYHDQGMPLPTGHFQSHATGHSTNANQMQHVSRHYASHSVPAIAPVHYQADNDQITPTYRTVHDEQRMAFDTAHHQQRRQSSQMQQQQCLTHNSPPQLMPSTAGQFESVFPSQRKSPKTTASNLTPELQIQHYSPREPAQAPNLPPKTKNTPPKEYTFHHHGPETFSGPEGIV
ncbi:MAG: hypothetical protein M1828_002750 [Chrysothrix sp. TS-e1954]|nr:MAG: hypothetical protein M1828_002750 [Chrysothrix sp. TS-e1954]